MKSNEETSDRCRAGGCRAPGTKPRLVAIRFVAVDVAKKG